MIKTAAIKLWVNKIASLWLSKKGSIEQGKPTGSEWDMYDRVMRLAILEGALHVPLGSMQKYARGMSIQTIGERTLSAHPQIQPIWFQYKDTGMALDIYQSIRREFVKFKTTKISPMDIINANLSGISAQNFDPDEVHKVASSFYRAGDKNKTKILDGTYEPKNVTNAVIGLLVKATTSPTRAYLTQEIIRKPGQDRSADTQITRLVNATDEQKRVILRKWQQAGIHPAFTSIMASLFLFWSKMPGKDDTDIKQTLARKYNFAEPTAFMGLVKKGLGISDRIIGVPGSQILYLDKERSEDAPGHALHETVPDTRGHAEETNRQIFGTLLRFPHHPVSRRVFQILEDNWEQAGGSYTKDGEKYNDGVLVVMSALMSSWTEGGGRTEEAEIKKRLAAQMGVTMASISNWKDRGAKEIDFVMAEHDVERLVERFMGELEGRRMASKKKLARKV